MSVYKVCSSVWAVRQQPETSVFQIYSEPLFAGLFVFFLNIHTFRLVVRVAADCATMSVAGLKKQFFKASQVRAPLCH